MITITVDGTPAENYLAKTVRQLPFAAAKALNDTAVDVQQAIRHDIADSFTLRQPRWILLGVKIDQFIKKSAALFEVTVSLDPTRNILAKFETGGTKVAHDPMRPIAIPSRIIRPDRQLLPPRNLYPSSLGLTPRRQIAGGFKLLGKRVVTSRGVVQLKGKKRTFVLTLDMHGVQVPGVYQRFGPGAHDFHLLWTYKDKIPIPHRPFFYDVGVKTIRERWPVNFGAAWTLALATAR